ncbi:protein translocase subunit SecD [Bryobacter aggregatus]|uniref:protein translocase subunit SecD n=1 Tax=Bryobacter aggregatus TaxID=360054 RepID=UPI0004E13688|nr:protein translocase subunit SecD [Bryobacter aggregatus]
MERSLGIKIATIVGVTLICIYGIIGIPKNRQELAENFEKNIKLGLDLKGGSQLVLQVQVQDAFKAEADQVIDRIKNELRSASIEYGSFDRNEPTSIETADKIEITAKGIPSAKAGDFRKIISDRFTDWNMTSTSGTDYKLTYKTTAALDLRKKTVGSAIHTIENRIDGLGLAEASVQQRGAAETEPEILIQMPGVDDPARIKQILQTAALLELYEVQDGPFASRDQMLGQFNGILPAGTKAVRGMGSQESWFLLKRTPVITGRDLRDSRAAQDQMNSGWVTTFVLSQDAAQRFGRFTEANINKRLAIVLDNQVRSAPTIQSKISDNGQITGAANQQDANDLALILRAGSLPASVVYLEERTVGPSLGADSIREGLMSGLVGLFAVIFVMLVYYKKSGINATVALILNAIILIAVLAYVGATLTLPGIAGVVLTIGMAVDSNVLIFERIREELREGKSVRTAIDAGFSRAFLTIIDTHVTAIVSSAFLFIFGTTNVKGFAVTLIIGLLANVFTAVFVSKVIFDWELSGNKKVTELSI